MRDISKITLPSGTTYNIKDATAREAISTLSNYTKFLGVTTTALTDGATTTTVVIGSTNVTAATGNIVTYNNKEFIFNGTKWQEFGDLSGLGALAYKDQAMTYYTPKGTVSKPTFSGTAHNHTATFTGSEHNHTASFKGTSATISPSITANESASTKNYTPKGSVSLEVYNADPGKTLTKTDTFKLSSDGSYTPSVSVSSTATYHKNTQTFTKISSFGTLPTLTTSVSNETLSIDFNRGTLPTGSNSSITGIGDNGISVSNEVSGTKVFIVPTFAGTGVGLTASASYTPSGTVTVVKATQGGSVTVKEATAGGTVSQPTFTGTESIITVKEGIVD